MLQRHWCVYLNFLSTGHLVSGLSWLLSHVRRHSCLMTILEIPLMAWKLWSESMTTLRSPLLHKKRRSRYESRKKFCQNSTLDDSIIIKFCFQGIDEFATRLIDSNHYASDEVGERRDALVARRANIKLQSGERRDKLEESRKLQQFERDADEVEAWINEKMKTACDESYKVEYCQISHCFVCLCIRPTLGNPNYTERESVPKFCKSYVSHVKRKITRFLWQNSL